ncbi:MAG: hypothetical protein RLZZ66_1751 [Pseudomonadota bacterium]|jgi:hypothetical protein
MSISTSNPAQLLTSTQTVNSPSQVKSTSNDALKLTVATIKADANNGSLMRSATQALQSLGLSIGSGSANNNSSSSTVSSTSPLDVKKVLQVFLQDLYKTLTQSDVTPSQNGSNTSTVSGVSTQVSAYNNPSTSMQNLISTLDNNSSQHTPLQSKFHDLVNAVSGTSSSDSNSAEPNVASSANLQDFLKQLSAINGNNSLPSGVGSLFDATA